jgi:hypothetical protein
MISIIICSINNGYLKNVSENISKTIGIEYELLVWDNLFEKKGICAVYNMLAEQAKFPLLCFLHEDVFFETDGWGAILSAAFRDIPRAGVVGLAGSSYKSAMYSGWHTNNSLYDYFNYSHLTNGIRRKVRQPADSTENVFPVVCIDGVFIACRREIWRDILFDEQRLRGFHFYDIDFSLRAAGKYGVVVIMNIDLVHITQGGDYGDRWVEAAMQFHAECAGRLPFYLGGTPGARQVRVEESGVAALWLDRLKGEKISLRNKWRWVMRQGLWRRGISLWYPIVRFILFRPLKLYKLQRIIKKLRTSP